MPRTRHLHLDNVITSMPELGPTVPDGGYSWLIFVGVIAIKMTVPSVLAIYGVVLSYVHIDAEPDIHLWQGSVTLTPILLLAFWNLTDPWSRTIVNMDSVPRAVGLIGVFLLIVGVLASGYLTTEGIGSLILRLSAGGVMGIGASLVIMQSENLLRRHFRTRLALVLTMKHIANSLGITIVPAYAYMLLENAGLRTGTLLFATVLVPGILGACTFDAPVLKRTMPYSLLISEEDNELNIRDISDVTTTSPNPEVIQRRASYEDAEITREGPPTLFSEENNSYAYDEPADDINLFVTPIGRVASSWTEEFRMLLLIKFWSVVPAWFGTKASMISFFVLSPSLILTEDKQGVNALGQCVTLTTVIGLGMLLPGIMSYWSPRTARCRSIYFGCMCWLGAAALLGLAFSTDYAWSLMWSFFGGVSIMGCAVGQESVLRDLLGPTGANRAHTALSMIVGFILLLLIFVKSFPLCLQIVAITQLMGGSYWILNPIVGA
ncbi:uncharacterized protein LOC105691323 [Athalia rosae]|uniref:uncharacterized protein LOC105691323 n=1 Tax=Athalia rosae TaxID=37344 RepID=UPI002033ABB3|nr:uncharacterized protein LOC105691323 [Athalia rosae]